MKRLAACLLATSCLAAAVEPSIAEPVNATLGWSQRVELGMLVSGVVSEVHVAPGQAVAAGDPLVSLDTRGFASEVDRWTAELRHAQSVLAEARRKDDRAAELYDRTVLSDYERNQAAIALQGAGADAARAKAALTLAQLNLEHAVLRAPFDGLVLAVNAAVGQSVVSELQSAPLVTVANHRRLQARARVNAELAARLQPGQSLSGSVDGQSVDGKINYVDFEPQADAGADPLYSLVVDIAPPASGTLRVGQKVELQLDP